MLHYWEKAISVLKKGGVGILPTDTLFGVVGSAFSKNAVEKIYQIKGRDEGKPVIVLVSSYHDLERFNIEQSLNGENWNTILSRFWPGKVSIILPCKDKNFTYLHRGTNSIAFRMISKKNKNLFNLLKKVGPIVAPECQPSRTTTCEKYERSKGLFS